MWNIPDLAASSTHIFRGNLFSETFLNYFFKRCNIVFLESGILEEFTFQGEGSALSLASINRQRHPWSTKGQTNLVMAILTLHHRVFHNVHEIQIFATHSCAVIQTRIGKVRTRHAHRMDVNGFGEVTGRRDVSWLCSCWAIDYPTELHLTSVGASSGSWDDFFRLLKLPGHLTQLVDQLESSAPLGRRSL